MPCPDPRRERGRVQTERGGGSGPGLPNAGEYEIPATGASKTLLVLVVSVGHLVKVLVLPGEEAHVLSVLLRMRASNIHDMESI